MAARELSLTAVEIITVAVVPASRTSDGNAEGIDALPSSDIGGAAVARARSAAGVAAARHQMSEQQAADRSHNHFPDLHHFVFLKCE